MLSDTTQESTIEPSPLAIKLSAGKLALDALDTLRQEASTKCWCKADKLMGHTWGCLLAQSAKNQQKRAEEAK